MNNPELSIIVPVYKVEKYLEDCVESILTQTFSDFELILVDDGSPDSSPALCDEFAKHDNRIRVIHQTNGGLSSARNNGLNSMQGKYVTFIDSDDRVRPDSLKCMMDEMKSSNADIVLAAMERFTENGSRRPYTNMSDKREMSGKEALRIILQGRLLNISACGGIYKRFVFDKLRFPNGFICEDWYITPDIYFNTPKVVFIPIPWYEYRDNPQSTMGILLAKCNPQIIEVAEYTIIEIKSLDHDLYLSTLWFNLRRVWKWVGIIYSGKRQNTESEFLEKVRKLLALYWRDLKLSGGMNTQEMIGVWCFCFCLPLFRIMSVLKH